MAFFQRKRYNIFVKLIAIALFIISILAIIITISIVVEFSVLSSYDSYSYYEWNITGHTVEKLDDGKYTLTLDVKNTSAYDAYIDKYTLKLEYGDYNEINYPNVKYAEGYFYETLNETFIPQGETIKHSITFEVPEGLNSLRVRYNGTHYKISELRGDDSYKYYEIDLK